MFNFITLKPFNLDTKYITDIQEIIEKVITEKKDEYWKNYKDYSIFDQTMITVGLVNDIVKTFSSIYTRSFYDNDVYRLFNRFLISDDVREDGGSKMYRGDHRFLEMIDQQVKYVKTLGPKFYFLSRQRKNTRWLTWYFDKYNKKYNENLIVSKDQYRICGGSEYDCCQTLIYPKDMQIPFEKLYK